MQGMDVHGGGTLWVGHAEVYLDSQDWKTK